MTIGESLIRDVVKAPFSKDGQWAQENGRHSFWRGPLRQQIWFEDLQVRAKPTTRMHVRTDVFSGFKEMTAQMEQLHEMQAFGTLSGFVRSEADRSRVQLAATLCLHAGNASRLKDFFLGICLLQHVEAYFFANAISQLDFDIAASNHPTLGQIPFQRAHTEKAMNPFYKAGGKSTSFGKSDLMRAHQVLQRPPGLRPEIHGTAVAADFPFNDESSSLLLRSDEPHPQIGAGICVDFLIPIQPLDYIEESLRLNEFGLTAEGGLHSLGTWMPIIGREMADTMFVPSVLNCGGLIEELALNCVVRAVTIPEVYRGWIRPSYIREYPSFMNQ